MPDRFEENLRALLTRAYEPPPYRQEFYEGLLARLKAEQRQLLRCRAEIAARRRRLAIGVSLAAASVALAAMAVLEVAGSPKMASAGAVVTDVPAVATASAAKGHFPSAFVLSDIRARGCLEYQERDQAGWERLEADSVVLRPGAAVRVVGDAAEGIAHFRLANGRTAVALQPATVLQNDGGHLALLRGGVHAAVGEGDDLAMAVADFRFVVAPGSEIFLKREADRFYAGGGEPAPQLMVMKGEVIAAGDFATRLPAGHLFLLYKSSTGAVAGQSLEETEMAYDVRPRDVAIAAADRPRDTAATAYQIKRRREVLALGTYLFFTQGERLIDVRCQRPEEAERIFAGTPRFVALAAKHPEIDRLAQMRCAAVVICGGKAYEIVCPSAAVND